MKTAILLTVVLFVACTGYTQDKLPPFEKVEKEDLQLTDCSFDAGAEAMILFDVGELGIKYAGDSWQSETFYRMRVKVLKASAVDRAQVRIRYYSKNRLEEITNVHAISFNLDEGGNIVESKLDNKGVYDKPIDKEYSEISFAIPNVKVGSVFEYRYRYARKSYSYIPSWYFQTAIPCRYSAYYVQVPEYFQFTVQSTLRQRLEAPRNKSDVGRWFILHNIPGLKSEPYSAGLKDYIQRVDFKLARISSSSYNEEFQSSWTRIIDQLLEDADFGQAFRKNIRGTAELDAQLPLLTATSDRIRAIYNYVQQHMQWDGNYGIFSDYGTRDAWDKKNGSVTDINFILLRLLRDAGIDAKPLLVSTRDNGTVNVLNPFLRQFNCVMVYVREDNKVYVLNAADKYNPFQQVPYDVLYTHALIVDKKEGGLTDINGQDIYDTNVYFTSSVDANGKLEGQATIKSGGYARNIRLHRYATGKLKETLEENSTISLKIDSFRVAHEKDETKPLEQSIGFSGSMPASGDYYFLPYNLFTSLDKNPFIEDKRVTDIDFNFPRKYTVSGTWFVDEGFIVNELPKNTRMIMPDTSITFTRMMQSESNVISYRFTLEFKSPGYLAENYPYVKEFFRQLYSILEERIVLKKK